MSDERRCARCALHCAPLPEPEGALCAALWLRVMAMESVRNEAQEAHAWALKRFLWSSFRWLPTEGGGRDACTWKRADLCMPLRKEGRG